MDAALTPEPQDAEREAILAAVARGAAGSSSASENENPWRLAGLAEATEGWNPVTGPSDRPLHGHDVLSLRRPSSPFGR